eukprot:350384-Chlamydomonas_euryale.AAC.5
MICRGTLCKRSWAEFSSEFRTPPVHTWCCATPPRTTEVLEQTFVGEETLPVTGSRAVSPRAPRAPRAPRRLTLNHAD